MNALLVMCCFVCTNIEAIITFFLKFLLAMPHGLQDLCSPTRVQTRAPCSESVESKQLDRQGIPL